MHGSRVLSLGHYQPNKLVTNDELATTLDTSDGWIQQRVGIRSRRIADAGETVDEMAVRAAVKALAQGGLQPDDVDLLLVATCTAIDRSPNTAARVANTIGMRAPAAIDINVACSSFTHALAVADLSVRTGSAENVLVIGADKLSQVTDWTDRSTCVLVGDGAGAAVVTRSASADISPVVWGSAPEMGRAVLIEGEPARFAQDGRAIYRWVITELPPIALRICERAGVAPQELAGVVLHQANRRIIRQIVGRLGAVNAVVAEDVVESGNTSAASIPLALSKLVASGAVTSGQPILLLGFGGGLAYAGQVVLCP